MKNYYLISILFLVCSCKNVPDLSKKNKFSSLTRAQAIQLSSELYQKYAVDLINFRAKEIENQLIELDGYKLKYNLKTFGQMPQNGWRLFISLHGGGGVDPEINERQWNRHKILYSLEQGVLLTPRSPTETWNMWHQAHIDDILNRLLQNMIDSN